MSTSSKKQVQLKYLFNSRAEKSCLDRMMETLIVSDADFVYADDPEDDSDIHSGVYSVITKGDSLQEQKLISDLFVN